jgi:hypothetical protein
MQQSWNAQLIATVPVEASLGNGDRSTRLHERRDGLVIFSEQCVGGDV